MFPACTDYSQTISLNPQCNIYEHSVADQTTGDQFVSLTITEGISTVPIERVGSMPWMDVEKDSSGSKPNGANAKDLKLIPYYFRANRGGRGQMRVGMKRAL